tara:strand:- start:1568 stop:1873 length:306 start_codon:yes stop_codon:yes gene_type:complete
MSKYAEDEQYIKYLSRHPLSRANKPNLLDSRDPFKSINYNNNKKNPLYKNVNSSQMDIRRFNVTGIKKKVIKGIKICNKEKNTTKGDECLMITCNNKVCFC